MKHDRTPYTWWCDENEDDDGGSVDDEVDVDDDSDGHHYDSNGVTIRKIFGHLMNGNFWKEKKIKEMKKVKRIESENQNAKKVKVENKHRRGSKKSGLQTKSWPATM